MLWGELAVAKVNRPLIGAFSVFLLCLSCWGTWFYLSAYLSFFKLNDVIVFSWRVGFAIFGVPLPFYFSYVCFFSAIKNKHIKINNKLGEWLIKILIFGAVVSFFHHRIYHTTLILMVIKSVQKYPGWIPVNM